MKETVESGGVELGGITGKFTRGLVAGFLKENRLVAEAIADRYDEAQEERLKDALEISEETTIIQG